ncbi:MAG: hypothetical protein KDC80_12275 [Saprospiraceae bacterium]|nr:hypothetical protein [Saprospiraceae bacterium]
MIQKITLPKYLTGLMTIAIFLIACDPPEPPVYESPESPLKLGTYLVADSSDLGITHYEMGIHWFGGGDQVFELCNFGGGRMSVMANVLSEDSFRIAEQIISDGVHLLEILQGTGQFTDSTFRIIYWGKNETGVQVSHVLTAELR